MNTTEAEERVARAICAKEFENPDTYWGEDPIAEAVDRCWQDYVETARVAIKALGDVTPARHL